MTTSETAVAAGPTARRAARVPTLAVLAAAMVGVGLLALCIGPVTTPPGDALTAVWRAATGQPALAGDALVVHVRLPRVLTSLLVGAGLGVAGAAMQAVFRNPLAEPGVTGVSSGAATVAVLMIVTGAAAVTPWALPIGAFAGALAATAIVQVVGLRATGSSPATLLLVGMAMNAFLGALINAMIANARDAEDGRSAMFWLNGDLSGRTLDDVALAVVPLVVGTLGVLLFARDLDVLLLGHDTAESSGVAVRRTSHVVLALAALATAGGVAITGIIAFVGLVVPHLVRLVHGSGHRLLLPASALLGAAFLTAADTVARMLFSPVSLQTGTITALVGAPFLLVLVLRRLR